MNLQLLGQRETAAARKTMRDHVNPVHPNRLMTPQERAKWANERFGLLAHVPTLILSIFIEY